MTDLTRLPLTKETRDDVLKPLKQGDETWDDLLLRLAERERAGDIDDLDQLAQAVAQRVAENQPERQSERANATIDEDRIIEALRQEVRDAVHEAVRDVAGAQA